MKRSRSVVWVVAVAVVALGLCASGAVAQPVVDQSQLAGDGNYPINNSRTHDQTFTVGVAGPLAGVEVALGRSLATTSLTFELLTTSGGVPRATPVLASVTIPTSSLPASAPAALVLDSVTGTYVDLSSAHVVVTAGQQLAFRLSTAEYLNSFDIRGNSNGASYPFGAHFEGIIQGGDLTFKTFVGESTSVPAISRWGVAVLILTLGVVGLLAARRIC